MVLRDQLQAALGPAYTLGRELGGGGMSRVFLADDTRLGRTVVVKVLAPELAAGINAERFEREIRVAASLQQANIVPLLSAGESDGLPFFIMPFVDGQSLRMRLASGPPLTPAECLSILRDVTRALSYAHAHGVVHRDIKPDNVLLSHGAAEVTDFGIAKAIHAARVMPGADTLTQLGTSVGTPAYMSPEQAAGDPNLDHRADLYAVGVLGYEMIVGHPPFEGTPQAIMAAHLSTAPPTIARREDVPPSLVRIIMKCLSKDPAGRHQSANELLADIEAVATPSSTVHSASPMRPTRVLAGAGAVAALVALVWFGTAGMRRERWVRVDAIPRIKQHIEVEQYDSAWFLARRAQEIVPNDSVLATLWPKFAGKVVITSTPAGASVYRAPLDDTTHWVLLGTTPTDSVYVPWQVGRIRVEKAGLRPFLGLMSEGSFLLDSVGSPDSDMVHIAGGTFDAFLVGTMGHPAIELRDFRLDRHEVTNRQYKAFVDAGGYEKREYWPDNFVSGSGAATWDAAAAKLTDKTGRPGPSTWEAGDYPAGQAELPVGGVSWYEAAAYAKFAGKSLPTIYHWAHAASVYWARVIVPGSNLGATGPVRGNTFRGMSRFGVFDMAGNVREWCENAAGDGERFILGGGWSDPPYGFTNSYAQPAMDRSAINGIRLARFLHEEPALALARQPTRRVFRDYAREKPVSPEVFETYRHLFDYDPAPLNAKIESRDTTPDDWTVEHVSFDAAYGGERMFVYVYLPKRHKPPYQSVVDFPNGGVIFATNSTQQREEEATFVVKTGRVFVLPVLKGTYERHDSLHSPMPDSTIFWRDHAVMWAKDIRRTIDYLSSRADMDSTRIAYFGYSWGAYQAPISLAVEPRFRTAVLYVAGLPMQRSRPEVDPLNFLPRVTLPVLMLNGKYDFLFPLELSQRPFFQTLGTPADKKKYIAYEGGHDVPRTELITQTLAWLDTYLGPVH
jgi:dienelactone hydrolase